MSRGSTAAKVREHKETWPELYCHVKNCLWRVKHTGGPDTPCRKHPQPLPQTEMPLGRATPRTCHECLPGDFHD